MSLRGLPASGADERAGAVTGAATPVPVSAVCGRCGHTLESHSVVARVEGPGPWGVVRICPTATFRPVGVEEPAR